MVTEMERVVLSVRAIIAELVLANVQHAYVSCQLQPDSLFNSCVVHVCVLYV